VLAHILESTIEVPRHRENGSEKNERSDPMHAKDLLPWNWHKGAERETPTTFFDEWFPSAQDPGGRRRLALSSQHFSQHFLPALDVSDEEKEILVTAELPGLEEKDFEVTLEDDMLTIAGEKRSDRSEKEEGGTWTERCYGSFERRIPLPYEVDLDTAHAVFKKGVLKLRLPKREPTPPRAKARVIPVEAGRSEPMQAQSQSQSQRR
jgi:HSP20 family molecular chaperone IbpA